MSSRNKGYKTLPSDIKSKTLELGVPARTTKQEWDDINNSIKNAFSKDIKVNITIIED
ncbi:endonuclease toxin domain-containing protein [Proteus mirabilis]|uniref:endonuclease toxin domain-containing protein n=1 Tax=Proteus mirabilis TaxID=584 RepID=UPI0034E421BE